MGHPARIRAGRWLLALLALSVLPEVVRAQVAGRVQDREGNAIEGANMALLRDEVRIAFVVTDAEGRFAFRVPAGDPPSHVEVRRIGYRTLRFPIPVDPAPLLLRLDPEAILLPGVGVEVPRDLCTRREDRAARAVWEEIRDRYAHGLDSVGIATYLAGSSRTASADDVDPPMPGVADEQRGSSFLLRFSWARRIDREGYGYRVRRPTPEGTVESWVYPPLHADLAPHFVEPLFLERNRVFVLSEGPEGRVIGFCPRGRPDGVRIRGTLTIGPDLALRRAEWAFEVPEPEEEAGGSARFAPPRETFPWLLPTEGTTWKRNGDGSVTRRDERYEGWILAPGDSVPFLPSRAVPGGST